VSGGGGTNVHAGRGGGCSGTWMGGGRKRARTQGGSGASVHFQALQRQPQELHCKIRAVRTSQHRPSAPPQFVDEPLSCDAPHPPTPPPPASADVHDACEPLRDHPISHPPCHCSCAWPL
jgi:hypothetical protein